MQEQHWNIITKYLSKESSEQETKILFKELEKDTKLKQDFEETKFLWDSLNLKQETFDKERILNLIKNKTARHKKSKNIIAATLKYAAIFLGLLVITTFVYKDLTSIKTISNNTNKIQKIKLPDNSNVTLNKNAKIQYANSLLKSFNRKIKIEGEAFFEITKSEGKEFIVQTPDFNINVLGTKFNVRTFEKKQSVTLTEGKIIVNNFNNINSDILMNEGETLKYSKEKKGYVKYKTNTKIYTSWLKNKLEFDNFSLSELAELIKLRYNKDLIINNKETANKKISGTAPSDDLNLILKALETILKTEIQHKENQLLIN